MNSHSSFTNLLYDVQAGICTITLNRPQVHHALNAQLISEITLAFQMAGKDDSVRVIVLTASGDKAFCSGADLKEGLGTGEKTFFSDSIRQRYIPMILSIRNLPKPVICRLNGIAAGAGCSLALACDLIIASEEAALAEIFVNIGLIMDAGSSYFLPRLVGTSRAFELCSTGRIVKAPEAGEMGLVNQVVPAARLDAAVAQLASYYSQAPTKAIGLMKQILNQSGHSSLEQVLELEAGNQDLAGNSQDCREGVRAFLEKRKPVFTGS